MVAVYYLFRRCIVLSPGAHESYFHAYHPPLHITRTPNLLLKKTNNQPCILLALTMQSNVQILLETIPLYWVCSSPRSWQAISSEAPSLSQIASSPTTSRWLLMRHFLKLFRTTSSRKVKCRISVDTAWLRPLLFLTYFASPFSGPQNDLRSQLAICRFSILLPSSGGSFGLLLGFQSFRQQMWRWRRAAIDVSEPAKTKQRALLEERSKKEKVGSKRPLGETEKDGVGNLSLRLRTHCREAALPAEIRL